MSTTEPDTKTDENSTRDHCENGAFGGTVYYNLTSSGGSSPRSASYANAHGPWPNELKAKMDAAIQRSKGRDVTTVTEEEMMADDFDHPYVADEEDVTDA